MRFAERRRSKGRRGRGRSIVGHLNMPGLGRKQDDDPGYQSPSSALGETRNGLWTRSRMRRDADPTGGNRH
ncbi:hypothetical protein IFM47457_04881 [Aspergillus lentulus]|nr:hypothetical protein IFM47457_04881 [Aspergillus lentulus]